VLKSSFRSWFVFFMLLPSAINAQEVDRDFLLGCHASHVVALGMAEAIARAHGGEVNEDRSQIQRERFLAFADFIGRRASEVGISSDEVGAVQDEATRELSRLSQDLEAHGGPDALLERLIEEARQCAIRSSRECMISC